jgi:putative transcriptional regulator
MKGSRRSRWSAAALLVAATLAPLNGVEDRRAVFSTTSLESGRLLVARPGMVGPNFSKTVVLLLSYGNEGAMGVIVNRPTHVPLSEVLPEIEALAERHDPVFSGGPMAVNGLIFAIRSATPPAGCRPVLPDVCAGGSLELLKEALADEQSVTDFRGFAGHAGWAPGQLEWEIERRGWYVLPGDSKRVFDGVSNELWSDLVRVAESPVA